MKKHIFIVFILLAVLLSNVTAGGMKESSEKLTEARIISLAPNITELVYALDCGDYLVGRTINCNYPEECLNVPVAADSWMPNVENIVALEPTVVLVSSLTDPSSIQSIKDAGINIIQVNYEESLDGTISLINELGRILGKEDKAKELVKDFSERIEILKNKLNEVKEPKTAIYIISWGDWGDYAATGDTFINGILEAAGCINVANEAMYWSISKELLLDKNPEIIILPEYEYMKADIEGFKNTEPYNQLSGNIVTIDGDIIERQGLRTIQAIEEIAKISYPELF